MPTVSYRILGVDRLLSDLLRDEQMFEDFTEKVVEDVAIYVETQAKKYCPVDTGKLRASIQRLPRNRFHIDVIADTEYARYVEYGTSGRREQSYMRIAGNEADAKVHKFIIKGLRRYFR